MAEVSAANLLADFRDEPCRTRSADELQMVAMGKSVRRKPRIGSYGFRRHRQKAGPFDIPSGLAVCRDKADWIDSKIRDLSGATTVKIT
ncbi:MAG: hypothetical protein ACLQGP_15885 [Isosphaeraceae bacterium]